MRLQPALDRLSDVARDIAGQPDSSSAVARAVDLAAKILRCTTAELVRLRPPNSLVLVASTDPAGSGQVIDLADDATSRQSWTRLTAGTPYVLTSSPGPRADSAHQDNDPAAAPAHLIIAVTVAGTDRYFLRLLDTDPTLWTEDHLRLATVYADLAGMAIDLAAMRSRTEHLTRAVQSNRQIGAAIGILMAGRKVSQERAFELLREYSQRRNEKLWEVARELVLDNGMPAPAAEPAEPFPASSEWGTPSAGSDRGADERSRVR